MYYGQRQFPKEDRWEFKYERDGHTRYCYPRSKESIEDNRKFCLEKGWKVLSVKKVYPFSTEKNQHNFELIRNVCSNRMHDMDMGDIPYDGEAYDKMYDLKERAEQYMGLPLPVAWLPYEQLKEAKEIVAMAHEHRYAANLAAGNYRWLHLC
ncbi:MAG: hypothetical protein IKU35_06590 [Bacteroidaceae bacterium]|nr:hypothetical protein [Bacteroidaceae bacterium]